MSEDNVSSLYKSIIQQIKEAKTSITPPSISIMDITDNLWNENINSDIIAAFINKRTTGALFLKRIEKLFGNSKPLAEDTSISASREDHVKGIGEDASGRTDITLLSPDFRIIIENKILSGDGDNQLRKYIHHWEKERSDKKEERTIQYCYLTLWGTKPSEKSLWGNDAAHSDPIIQHVLEENRLIFISYRHDILEWLEEWEIVSRKECNEDGYLCSAVNQYKGAVIKMIHEDIVTGIIRQHHELLSSLDEKECETFIEIIDKTKNILKKLDSLAELRKALEARLKADSKTAHLADKLRYTINQSGLFNDFELFRQKCLEKLDPSTYPGLVCCAKSTEQCYGIGYEFTEDISDIKRKIGFMLGGKNGEYWEKGKNEKAVKEKETISFLANDLYWRIQTEKNLYGLE